MQKRSITIAGHRTSLALEPEFWAGLEALATSRALPLAALIREIDEARDNPNLSSAIRLAVLRWYQERDQRRGDATHVTRRKAAMGVTGIGGFFFRAKDPEALRAQYAEHLGVGAAPHGAWDTEAGPSVFAPFPAATDYFAADHQWMLNLRVDNLDELCATLRAVGIEVTTDPDWNMPGVGRFARIHDPEGNPIELWEPDRTA